MSFPGLGFRYAGANKKGEKGRQAAGKKQGPPAKGGKDQKVSGGGQQIAQGIAFLEQPREETAAMGRHRFHRQRGSDAPFAAHADTIECAQEQERTIGGGESA